MAATMARFSDAPTDGATRRYYQHINKFSAAFAFATDMAMLTLGGYLKQKEHLSARLGDVLSALYMASMVLKHYENQGRPEADLPLVEWSCRTLLYEAQEQLHGFLRNFPNRWVAGLMRVVIFPRGRTYFAPSDRLGRRIVEPLMVPSETRERLSHGIYKTVEPGNPIGLLQEALVLSVGAEPLEKRLRVEGVKTGRITALDLPGQIEQAVVDRAAEPGRGAAAARLRPQGHGHRQRGRLLDRGADGRRAGRVGGVRAVAPDRLIRPWTRDGRPGAAARSAPAHLLRLPPCSVPPKATASSTRSASRPTRRSRGRSTPGCATTLPTCCSSTVSAPRRSSRILRHHPAGSAASCSTACGIAPRSTSTSRTTHPACGAGRRDGSATGFKADRRVLPHREEFVRGAVSTENCLNCGEVLTGQHCSHCGQHVQGTGAVAVGTDQGRDRRPARRGLARVADAVAARVPAGTADPGIPARPARALHAAVPDVPGAEPGVLRASRRSPTRAPRSRCSSTRAAPTSRCRDGADSAGRVRGAGDGCEARRPVRRPGRSRPARPNPSRRRSTVGRRRRLVDAVDRSACRRRSATQRSRSSRRRWRRPPRGARAARRVLADPCSEEHAAFDAGPVLEHYEPRLREACRKIMADQQTFGRALFENMPKMMFIFLPLIAAVLSVLYVRSGRYYVEHLLFVVHFHAFFFLAGIVVLLLERLAGMRSPGRSRAASTAAQAAARPPRWSSTCRGTCSGPCAACTRRAGGRPCRSSRCWGSPTSSAWSSPARTAAYTALTL